MAAAICFAIASFSLLIWLLRRDSLAYFFFAVTAFGAGFFAVTDLVSFYTYTAEGLVNTIRWANLGVYLILIGLVWFIHFYFQTARRWLAQTITILWTILLIINFISPYSMVFDQVNDVQKVFLPWGEHFSRLSGTRAIWADLADILSLVILIYYIDASVHLWKKGEHKRAGLIGGSIVLFMTAAGVHTPMVDMGLISTPYLVTFSYLFIVVAMTIEISYSVIRSSQLSKEVIANEQRWRSLLEEVKLLIVEITKDGTINYINPYFLKSTGYQDNDLLGKPYIYLIPEEDRAKILELAQTIQTVDELPHYQTRIVARTGEKKMVNWSNVGIFDSDGSFTGTLAVGADVTDREKAFMEIEQLKNSLQEENIYLKEELVLDSRHQHIIGKSDALKYALTRVEQVAPTDTTVLIEGETGVGKELFARAIHQASGRANQVFIEVNCPAIPSNLIESELFGHEKGSFTGAHTMRKGRFEVANKGTLFLDEIGELPPGVQSKLLRILEEGGFERVGSSVTHMVDVRVIAATNRNLKVEVNEGRFRDDLYYRLSAYPISVPPLRKRKEDIPLLIESFVDKFSRKLGKKIDKIPREILQKLLDYSWPGNVRELRNVMESSVIGSVHKKLILSSDTRNTLSDDINEITEETESLSLEEVERQYILKILNQCNWRINGEKGAANILDIHPNTLRNRMIKLNIAKP
jgi:PAS domain S-box-containing protein